MIKKLLLISLTLSALTCVGLWIYSAVAVYGMRPGTGKVAGGPLRGWKADLNFARIELFDVYGRNGCLEVNLFWGSDAFVQTVSTSYRQACGVVYARGAMGKSRYLSMIIPFWMLVVGCSSYPFTALVRASIRRHRHRRGRVCKCGYNLTGNISGICPECGTPVPAISNQAEPVGSRPRAASQCSQNQF